MRKLAILAAAVALIRIGPAAAAELAPHEASFTSTLQEYHGPGKIDSWEEKNWYRVSRDCQKWTSEQNTDLQVTVNGVDAEVKGISKDYEALDGHRLEFNFTVVRNGQTIVHRMGTATLRGKGMPGTVKFRAPTSESIQLPAGTLFPVAAEREMFDLAAKGKKHWTQVVFEDGELVDYSFKVLDQVPKPAASPKDSDGLLTGPGWIIEMRRTSRSSHNNSRTVGLMHANGTNDQYVTFERLHTTTWALTQIRALPSPQC